MESYYIVCWLGAALTAAHESHWSSRQRAARRTLRVRFGLPRSLGARRPGAGRGNCREGGGLLPRETVGGADCRRSQAWTCGQRGAYGAPGLVAGERLNKKTPSGETAWGPEVHQFRLWAEQVWGDGEPPGPPKLRYSTAHASPETITPLYSTDYLFVSFTVQAERSNAPTCLR